MYLGRRLFSRTIRYVRSHFCQILMKSGMRVDIRSLHVLPKFETGTAWDRAEKRSRGRLCLN